MNSKQAEEFKGLKKRKTKLEAEVSEKRDVMSQANREYSLSDKELKRVTTRIKDFEQSIKDMTVTDHAMVRYFERVLGIDIEEVKKQILTENVVTMARSLGNGKYPIENGCRVIVQNNSVVTIV